MMALYLVDTSALVRMRHDTVRQRLEPIIEAGDAATCAILDLEILCSARNHADLERIRKRRQLAYARVPVNDEIFDRVMDVQSQLARKGRHRLPIPDLIAAAAAEKAGLVVIHYDAHYDVIAEATGQPVEWVVKRGSVD
jgi:predicted nucleic acid-binding protein